MCHSWEKIMSFAPWVTHGVNLCAIIAHKMPKSMHNMRPYIGKELHHLPQKNIPVNYKILGYESYLHYLPRERTTSFASEVNPCALSQNWLFTFFRGQSIISQ